MEENKLEQEQEELAYIFTEEVTIKKTQKEKFDIKAL